MSRRYEDERPLLHRENGDEVEVQDAVVEGTVNGLPAFQVRNIAIVHSRHGTRTHTVTLTAPWMAGIPDWFFETEPTPSHCLYIEPPDGGTACRICGLTREAHLPGVGEASAEECARELRDQVGKKPSMGVARR